LADAVYQLADVMLLDFLATLYVGIAIGVGMCIYTCISWSIEPMKRMAVATIVAIIWPLSIGYLRDIIVEAEHMRNARKN
jgi:uncharacterized membrane protein (DUF106 family)